MASNPTATQELKPEQLAYLDETIEDVASTRGRLLERTEWLDDLENGAVEDAVTTVDAIEQLEAILYELKLVRLTRGIRAFHSFLRYTVDEMEAMDQVTDDQAPGSSGPAPGRQPRDLRSTRPR